MKVIKSINDLDPEEKIQVTIGNFDGVHVGHREFISRILKDCKENKCKFVVITFVPHPAQILRAQTGFLLNTFAERRELLSQCGVDYLLEIDFTRDFSTLAPKEFLEKFIFTFCGVKKIYLGHDFLFGANRSGNYKLAKELCEQKKVNLILQEEFRLDNHAISSSVVRSAIQSGEIEKASSLLGRSYFLVGRVIKGQGRGRQIGFPTANIEHRKELIMPSRGVYITQTIIHEMTYNSITNVGVNPTFNTGMEINIETHLLDFNRDIYGEEMQVCFLKKIRDEKKFSSVNDLVSQIELDTQSAKVFFKS